MLPLQAHNDPSSLWSDTEHNTIMLLIIQIVGNLNINKDKYIPFDLPSWQNYNLNQPKVVYQALVVKLVSQPDKCPKPI